MDYLSFLISLVPFLYSVFFGSLHVFIYFQICFLFFFIAWTVYSFLLTIHCLCIDLLFIYLYFPFIYLFISALSLYCLASYPFIYSLISRLLCFLKYVYISVCLFFFGVSYLLSTSFSKKRGLFIDYSFFIYGILCVNPSDLTNTIFWRTIYLSSYYLLSLSFLIDLFIFAFNCLQLCFFLFLYSVHVMNHIFLFTDYFLFIHLSIVYLCSIHLSFYFRTHFVLLILID